MTNEKTPPQVPAQAGNDLAAENARLQAALAWVLQHSLDGRISRYVRAVLDRDESALQATQEGVPVASELDGEWSI